jgi:tetratricopeptide (TPR) repeat protein
MEVRQFPLLVVLACLAAPVLSAGAPQDDDQIAAGLRQLDAAKTARSVQLLNEAEATFKGVVARQPENARALVHLGEVRLSQGGGLAAQGEYARANEVIQSATADMDRAVLLAPEDLDVRLTRGLAYGAFPPYLNKAAVARDDLQAAIRHARFPALPKDQRARAFQSLGNALTNLNDIDKAVDAFRAAMEADPDSRVAQDAKARLTAIDAAGAKPGTPYHPDRFPRVAAGTGPLIAVASITFPGARPGETPAWLPSLTKPLEHFAGLLGMHTVVSVDHPGMVILFTWWKDKEALNGFYYSDVHQAWMTGRGLAMTGERVVANAQVPTQVGIELFAPIPGGVQMNGGLVPTEIFQEMQRQNGGR